MFKHILVATDGSELSEIAIQKGIHLAKVIQARVTGIYAIPEVRYYSYETEIPAHVKDRHNKADSRFDQCSLGVRCQCC